MFSEGKLKLLDLTEMKLKGNGEVSWSGEAVAILLNDVWHSGVIDFGCISFRIL